MGLPQVHVSAIPMTERGINVLNLPLISGFVNNSIAAAANEYVAPKSMSLEVGKLISGDNVKKGFCYPMSEVDMKIRMQWVFYSSRYTKQQAYLPKTAMDHPMRMLHLLTRNMVNRCIRLVLLSRT